MKMRSLQKRLLELSPDEFESLVHYILVAKFPGAGIKKVDGSGGDQGIDSFSGSLSNGPAIWQSKYFRSRLGKSQKRSILQSIQSAFQSSKPSSWTLCVPIDFRTEEHKWFEKSIIDVYGNSTRIELIGASEILNEVTSNRNLRDAFFPENVISESHQIRQAMLNSSENSLEQKKLLTLEHAQQFLEDCANLDPRLEPQMMIGFSKPPDIECLKPSPVFAIRKSNVAISFIPRDPISYNLDPLSFNTVIHHSQHDKFKLSIDTGAAVIIDAGTILKFDSSSPLLKYFFPEDPKNLQLQLRPIVPEAIASRLIPIRLATGSLDSPIELPYIPMKVTQLGSQEVTLSSNAHLPIDVSIKIRPMAGHSSDLNLRPIINGSKATELRQVLTFFDQLGTSERLEVFSIDPPGRMFHGLGNIRNSIKILAATRSLILDLALISDFFDVTLCIPEELTEEEIETIQTLRRVASAESFSGMVITASWVKAPKPQDEIIAFLKGASGSMRMANPTGWQNTTLLGQTIDCGPVILEMETVTIIGAEESLAKYLATDQGELFEWKAACNGECRFVHPKHLRSSAVE